jgi:hypothetical protein
MGAEYLVTPGFDSWTVQPVASHCTTCSDEFIEHRNKCGRSFPHYVCSCMQNVRLFIFRTVLYLVFVLVLGSTCERETLLTDFMIAAKVSAVRKYHRFIHFTFLLEHCH